MNTEQQQAYDWAKTHDYPSIAARYARALASAVDDLQAQLLESQRRARAAVEDLHWMHTLCMDIGGCCPECGNQIDDLMDAACTYCKKSGEGCWEDDPEIPDKCSAFEWRGHQEAGKGGQ